MGVRALMSQGHTLGTQSALCFTVYTFFFFLVPQFGFSAPTFEGTESINGVAGTVNAEVMITNGVTIAEDRAVVVNCIPSATGSASTGMCSCSSLIDFLLNNHS